MAGITILLQLVINLSFLASCAHFPAEWQREIRREIHQHPETAFDEHETSKTIQRELAALNIKFTSGCAKRSLANIGSVPTRATRDDEEFIGGTGIIAEIGTGDSPCVALRADMDALPIQEALDVPWRSKVPERMHACGHDAHMAMLLGAARILKEREKELKGTVRLLFQPAEERGGGAQDLIIEGALEKLPTVESIMALHVLPQAPTGTLSSKPGPLTAAACLMDITVTGQGGHAGLPHLASDPIPTAAAAIQAIHVVVSRATTKGIVSITAVESSSNAHNVIPNQVRMKGTLRTLSNELMDELQMKVRRAAEGVAAAAGQTATVTFHPGYPILNNSPEMFNWAKNTLQNLGHELHEMPTVMGGEDFAFYCQHADCLFMFIGTMSPYTNPPSNVGLHDSQFNLDEEVMPIGSSVLAELAAQRITELLSRKAERKEEL